MSQQPAFTPRKKTMLTDYRLPHPLTEQPLEGGKYPAQLMFDQKNNGNIVLKVNDGVYKPGVPATHKEVDLDVYTRNALFEGVLEATTNPEFNVKQLSVRKKQFVHGPGGSRMSDQPIVQANLTIGRDKNGVISLGYSKGDYKAMFIFKGPNDSVLLVRQGEERVEDHGTMSRWVARAWVGFHRRVLDQLDFDGWQGPKPRNPQGNSGGNNFGGNNNNSGGGADAGFDESFDDVDF